MRRRHLLSLTAVAGLAAPSVSRGQGGWPDRPVRLIVPFPPGGSTDTIARIVQPKLLRSAGQAGGDREPGRRFRLGGRDRSGAGGGGRLHVAARLRQRGDQPDGDAPPYKLLEALAPVSLVATGPLALVAHQSTPWQSFSDVVAAAKAAPDSISFASSGVGGLAHVSTTLLQQQGGFRLVHVPYRGGGPALQDALSAQVPLFMSNVGHHQPAHPSRHPAARSASPRRSETRHVPGVKSFAQQGFAGFEAPTWWALLGRAGTPPADPQADGGGAAGRPGQRRGARPHRGAGRGRGGQRAGRSAAGSSRERSRSGAR